MLNAAECQSHNFYHFWVVKGKPTRGGGKFSPFSLCIPLSGNIPIDGNIFYKWIKIEKMNLKSIKI